MAGQVGLVGVKVVVAGDVISRITLDLHFLIFVGAGRVIVDQPIEKEGMAGLPVLYGAQEGVRFFLWIEQIFRFAADVDQGLHRELSALQIGRQDAAGQHLVHSMARVRLHAIAGQQDHRVGGPPKAGLAQWLEDQQRLGRQLRRHPFEHDPVEPDNFALFPVFPTPPQQIDGLLAEQGGIDPIPIEEGLLFEQSVQVIYQRGKNGRIPGRFRWIDLPGDLLEVSAQRLHEARDIRDLGRVDLLQVKEFGAEGLHLFRQIRSCLICFDLQAFDLPEAGAGDQVAHLIDVGIIFLPHIWRILADHVLGPVGIGLRLGGGQSPFQPIEFPLQRPDPVQRFGEAIGQQGGCPFRFALVLAVQCPYGPARSAQFVDEAPGVPQFFEALQDIRFQVFQLGAELQGFQEFLDDGRPILLDRELVVQVGRQGFCARIADRDLHFV